MPNLVLVNIAAGPIKRDGHSLKVTIKENIFNSPNFTLNFGATSQRPMPDSDRDLTATSRDVVGVGEARATVYRRSPDLRLYIFERENTLRLMFGDKRAALANLLGLERAGFNDPITRQIRNLII
jgi:hypothetical protein